MLVVVNQQARGGRATAAWPAVEGELRRRHPGVEIVRPPTAAEAAAAVRAGVRDGHDAVVMAGGDGSVNLGLNALMDAGTDRPLDAAVCLGAIGLGSSNDAHKPFADERRIDGVPVRIDPEGARTVDVGKATMLLADGSRTTRYFLLNASMGLVAEGNHRFNTATGVLAALKRVNTDVAIAVTALHTVLTADPIHLDIRSDAGDSEELVTSIGVCKSVHFAGDMRYDTAVTADDGHLDVNVWRKAGRVAVLRLIAGLYRGEFTRSPLADARRATWIELRTERPAPLETDGEITLVESVRLEVLPRVLRWCA